jgi:sugar/nucleoside kinase (ribokinase family)
MDVVCLGMLIADVFASPIDSLPAQGELKRVNRYILSAGGCAANTAACLHRLGWNAGVIGKVGKDLFGDFVLADLSRLGVDASRVRKSSAQPTSNTYIINVRGEDRRYLHCPGANEDFVIDDVDVEGFGQARVIYFGGYGMMSGFGPKELAHLFRKAKNQGLMTVLDVVLSAGIPAGIELVDQVLPYTDLFIPNNDEAEALTGEKDPAEQAEKLARYNPSCMVLITRGRKGVLVRDHSKTLSATAYNVESLDESGAGDAFTAGFISGNLWNWPLEKSLQFASAVGASCTCALGCTEGVFSATQALSFMARNELKIERLS